LCGHVKKKKNSFNLFFSFWIEPTHLNTLRVQIIPNFFFFKKIIDMKSHLKHTISGGVKWV
jgi:hypothetical protein